MQRSQQKRLAEDSTPPELKCLERSEERAQAFFQDIRQPRNRALMGMEKMSKSQKSTVETDCMSPQNSKRLKRKINRKKRRKRIQVLKQGINQLKGIFEKIYYMECTFEELREDIVIAIQKIPSEGEFVDRLNQLIRDYVEDTCDYLLEERSRFATALEPKGDFTKNCLIKQQIRMIQQTRGFEIEFITAIYEEFSVIKTSSEEIEKMIELYYQQSKNNNEMMTKQNKCPLYKSTFIFMMNHEIKLKKWLIDTDRHFQESQIQDPEAIARLDQMLNILYQYPSEAEHLVTEDYQISTVDSDQRSLELAHRCQNKKKKNHPNLYIDQPEQHYTTINEDSLNQNTIYELQRMEIKGPRLKCDFDKEWLRQIQLVLQTYSMKQ